MKTDATHKVTRLEIIDDGGRGYVNMRAGGIEMSLQDDDRTMKIFTKGRSNASDERMFTESEVRAMLRAIRHELEMNVRWQDHVEVVSASAMRQAFHRSDVLSLDPA